MIDDEPGMIEIATLLLEADGFVVNSDTHPLSGLKKIKAHPPDLILLDIALPDKDGFEVCKEIKSASKIGHIPVIMLSIKSEEANVVAGLKVGADDYITKPFRQQEMLARIHTALNRQDGGVPSRELKSGPFRIDYKSYSAWLGKSKLDLTPKEFELLAFFIKNSGCVLTRKTISESIWGIDFSSSSRNVDTHIDRLRKKLGRHGSKLKGLRGVGYRFEVDM